MDQIFVVAFMAVCFVAGFAIGAVGAIFKVK